jgi:hypothetical protein
MILKCYLCIKICTAVPLLWCCAPGGLKAKTLKMTDQQGDRHEALEIVCQSEDCISATLSLTVA